MKYEHEDLTEFLLDLKAEGIKKLGMRVLHDSKEAPAAVLVDNKPVRANTITALITLSAASKEEFYTYNEIVGSETVFSEEQLNKFNERIEQRTKEISTEIMDQIPQAKIFRGAVS